MYFSKPTITSEEFCGSRLHSIKATNRGETFLISVVTDTLAPGSYDAGLNYWGQWGFTNNITLSVQSYQDGKLHAIFAGTKCTGTIK